MPVFDFFHWNKNDGAHLDESGPIIQVEIGIPAALEHLFQSQGTPIPPPFSGYALIDTGASTTAIHEECLRRLGIPQIDKIVTHTPHGTGSSNIYPATISFPGIVVKDLPMNRVMGCDLKWHTVEGKEIIMLLGRDLLKHFLMVYNGKASNITLAY